MFRAIRIDHLQVEKYRYGRKSATEGAVSEDICLFTSLASTNKQTNKPVTIS